MNNLYRAFFILIGMLFTAPQLVAEGGVRGDTLIACAGGLMPVTKLYNGIKVWSMSEKGRVVSPISGRKSYPERFLIGITLEGTDKLGVKKKIEIVGAPSQRLFCPNRQEWVKFCELDVRFDLACINFCEPVHITKISEYSPFLFKRKVDVYSFEVEKYGMFFASELYVPLHNCEAITLTLGAYAIGFSIEFLLACASSLFVIAVVNEVDKLRGINKTNTFDDETKELMKKLNKAQADKLAAENAAPTPDANKKPHDANKPNDTKNACGTVDSTQEKATICSTPIQETEKAVICSTPIPEPEKAVICSTPLREQEKVTACSTPIESQEKVPACSTPISEPQKDGLATAPILFSCDNHGGTTVGQPIPAGSIPAAVADIVGEAILIKVGEESIIFVKPECEFDGMVTDFNRLQLSDAAEKPGNKGTTVMVGTTDEGSTVIARVNSSDKRPTLEIQNENGPDIKIRYGPEPPKANGNKK